MDDKEKNAEVAKAIKLPDLASYMQVVIKQLEIDKKWLSGEEAAKYFNVSVGEENTAVAAVQDYTKLYCKNTPEALAGGNPPNDTKDQAAAKEKEIRSKIAALTIQHME